MDPVYILTPLAAWFLAGATKFAVNSVKAGRPAVHLIGYGGLPSNHTCIVSAMAALIALREGADSPVFGVALTLAFIVVLDAGSLRREVGRHAVLLNRISGEKPGLAEKTLRERMGHTKTEILAGAALGCLVAYAMDTLF